MQMYQKVAYYRKGRVVDSAIVFTWVSGTLIWRPILANEYEEREYSRAMDNNEHNELYHSKELCFSYFRPVGNAVNASNITASHNMFI